MIRFLVNFDDIAPSYGRKHVVLAYDLPHVVDVDLPYSDTVVVNGIFIKIPLMDFLSESAEYVSTEVIGVYGKDIYTEYFFFCDNDDRNLFDRFMAKLTFREMMDLKFWIPVTHEFETNFNDFMVRLLDHVRTKHSLECLGEYELRAVAIFLLRCGGLPSEFVV